MLVDIRLVLHGQSGCQGTGEHEGEAAVRFILTFV